MRDGFGECERKYDMRFLKLIADGDSGVICELNNTNTYRDPMMLIEKIECSNHLKKNAKAHLRTILTKAPYKDFLTATKIDQLITAICCARKHWAESDKPFNEQVISLRQDIYNAPYHVFGSHDECDKYYCKGKKQNETNLLPEMAKNGLLQAIMDGLARLRQMLRAYSSTKTPKSLNNSTVYCQVYRWQTNKLCF